MTVLMLSDLVGVKIEDVSSFWIEELVLDDVAVAAAAKRPSENGVTWVLKVLVPGKAHEAGRFDDLAEAKATLDRIVAMVADPSMTDLPPGLERRLRRSSALRVRTLDEPRDPMAPLPPPPPPPELIVDGQPVPVPEPEPEPSPPVTVPVGPPPTKAQLARQARAASAQGAPVAEDQTPGP